MKEVAWAKLLGCCAMVFALLKNMSYKDIKITMLPKAPMTKSSLLRSFACIMRSPLFDFWRYVQPATLNKFSKPSCSSQRRRGCWRRCLRARRSRAQPGRNTGTGVGLSDHLGQVNGSGTRLLQRRKSDF